MVTALVVCDTDHSADELTAYSSVKMPPNFGKINNVLRAK